MDVYFVKSERFVGSEVKPEYWMCILNVSHIEE